jgi:K+-transporting ATPase ATPase A chain
MLPIHWLQLALFFAVLLITVKPLGGYIARVYEGERALLTPVCAPLERAIYRLAGVKPDEEMDWKRYALAALAFNLIGLLVVYALQRLQATRLLNPQQFGAVAPDLAFNTAVSFTSNTNWQSYVGERTLSYLTQMVGLTVQNFVSAATGMAVLIALIRGLARHSAKTIGSFWTDLVRGSVHILLPLSLVVALLLVSQGVVQTLTPSRLVSLIQPITSVDGQTVGTQTLALGPVASQVAIKQLGTNGGGFFNVNSAHPFENATPLSSFI